MRNFGSTALFSIAGLLLFPIIYQLVSPELFNGIVFCRGMLAICLILGATLVMSLIFSRQPARSQALSSAAFISFGINTALLVTLPVTIDRSVTTFLLEEIELRPHLTAEQLQERFISQYVKENGSTQRRLREQATIGTLVSDANGIHLTERGKTFLKVNRWVREIFLLPPTEHALE